MLSPTIIERPAQLLAGRSLTMSYAADRTPQLWQSFMPLRKNIHQALGADLYSLQVYPPHFFDSFNPMMEFEKWALIAVTHGNELPEHITPFELPGGWYAMFHHKGMDKSIFNEIYSSWLPTSGYELDHRPHFEVLGPKYKQGSEDSEEEIWIPIIKP